MKVMKRKNKPSRLRNILRKFPAVLAVLTVIYAGVLIRDVEMPELLPVNEIQVNGDLNFLDKNEIETTVRENISGDYFTVDLNQVRDVLMQEPWIKNVSLRRQWPASLNVYIEEQVPVAYWNEDGFINAAGDVFKPGLPNTKLNLPILKGPHGQHENVWKFMNTLYKETALLNYEVVRLNLDDRRAWQLVIAADSDSKNDHIEIKLGRFDTEKRMKRFIHILPALAYEQGLTKNKTAENIIKVIDMRYPNGFAVQMAEKNNSQSNSFNIKQNIAHNFVYAKQHANVQIGGA